MKRTVKERVQNGIKWLDTSNAIPNNWRSLINIDHLKFADPDYGPLGQIFNNNYRRGLYEARIVFGADELGFRSGYKLPGDPADLLQEWKHALRTDKKWYKNKDHSLLRHIKGVKFCIYQDRANIKVIMAKNGNVKVFPNNYCSYDSAMRAVRKTISTKL